MLKLEIIVTNLLEGRPGDLEEHHATELLGFTSKLISDIHYKISQTAIKIITLLL